MGMRAVTAVECPHGIPDPSWCSICRHGPTPTTEAPTRQWSGVARLAGHCDGCNLPINIGQPITRWSDGAYRHERCEP